MATPLVTIRKMNRELVKVENVALATDTDHARHITKLAIAMSNVEWEDVKLAEYTIDGRHVFAFLRQHDGMTELTPSKGEAP